MEDAIKRVYGAFADNQWEFQGYGVPELEDIRVVMQNCYDRLKDKPDGTVIEVGNISMRKSGNRYDFYYRLSSFEEKE